ncbi:MAG: RsmB/NOP family class I SAM-dependent RNA methyltransferase [Candidatus Pacearchaeota archaeon]
MKNSYEPKPEFLERMKILLNNSKDLNNFFESIKTTPKKSIRVNTLKISIENLIKRTKEKNWQINVPFENYPEIIQIISNLEPGEIGKAKEHILGYYYVQEITSMMPVIALEPKENEIILDLCASPGSKTTQLAAKMNNTGTIIANDVSIPRIKILSSNLERIGVTNTIITRHDGIGLSIKLKKMNFLFDKILVDAPCSGEGNLRSSPRTFLEWSENLIKNFSKKQKKLAKEAFEVLKINGTMVYSTCTHAPEENEEVIQYLLDTYKDKIRIEPVNLPIRTREGILSWKNQNFNKDIKKAVRIYPHDNDLEGFFLCKLRKIK